MSGGLIINSPLRHLGVQDQAEQNVGNREEANPRAGAERRESHANVHEPLSKNVVRKDRKICRGKFFIRRKNNRDDAEQRQMAQEPRSVRSAGPGPRPPSSGDAHQGDMRRSGEAQRPNAPRSPGFRLRAQSQENPRGFRENSQGRRAPVPTRGVPYHLRRSHHEEEEQPSGELQANP